MVVRKDLDNTSALLTVTISRDELKPKLDAELKKVRQRIPVKGFRVGHAPVSYLKKLYGPSIFSDTINDLFIEELTDYLRAHKVNILGQPLPTEDQEKFKFNIDNPEPEYKVTYEIGFYNDFEIKGIDKNTVYERYAVSNLDELAEEDLAYARKRMTKRFEAEADIQNNDMVRFDARELESADGEVLVDGYETTVTMLVNVIADEAFKLELLTKKKGDTVRFNARTLENIQSETRYRKYILQIDEQDDRAVGDFFEATIESVSRVEEPEMDETFFKDYFGEEVSSKEGAIDQLKSSIQRFYEERANALLSRDMQERLLRENFIELPDAFMKRWLKATNPGMAEEDLELQYPLLADNLRWSLLRDELKDRYDIEVSDEQIRDDFAQRILGYFQGQLPDHLVKSSVDRFMKKEEEVEKTRRSLEMDALFAALRQQVSLVDKPISSEDLQRILDEVSGKAKKEQAEATELIDALEVEPMS